MNPSLPPRPDDTAAAEERRLQELFCTGASDYIDDAGFTARVVGGLPAVRRHREWRRLLLVGTAALAGAGVAGFCGGAEAAATLAAAWTVLSEWSLRPVPGLAGMFTVGSALLLAASLAVCWRVHLREE